MLYQLCLLLVKMNKVTVMKRVVSQLKRLKIQDGLGMSILGILVFLIQLYLDILLHL